MKQNYTFLLFIILCSIFISFYVTAEEENLPTIFERILTTHGATLTLAEDFSDYGLGFTFFKSLVFLDGEDMNGYYMSFFLTTPTIRVIHPNDVKISDLRIAGFGYRGKTPIPNLGFDAAVSVAFGQRRIENTVYGDMYWGVSPEVGLYFPHNSPIDFEILFSPMFHVYNLNGQEVANKTYYDIHFLVSFKDFYRKFKYPWDDERG